MDKNKDKIKKAIIPAAGLGTRFLPATKSIPKEMLPLVDAPIIYYVVKEALAAGIEDIVLISGRDKAAIENFFDVSYEVQDQLAKSGKTELLGKLLEMQSFCRMISIRQKQASGLGHAVYCGRSVVGQEPFAVLLADEVMIAPSGGKNVTEVLTDSWAKSGKSSVAIMQVPRKDVEKYGIISGRELAPGQFEIADVVEKPAADKAPSTWALPGRYVFDARIFTFLENSKSGKNGEIQLTDSMSLLAKKHGLLGLSFASRRYDAGDKLGYLIANVELALAHPEVGADFKSYLKTLAGKL